MFTLIAISISLAQVLAANEKIEVTFDTKTALGILTERILVIEGGKVQANGAAVAREKIPGIAKDLYFLTHHAQIKANKQQNNMCSEGYFSHRIRRGTKESQQKGCLKSETFKQLLQAWNNIISK